MQKELLAPAPNLSKDTYKTVIGDNIQQKIPALFNKMQYLASNGYYGIGFNKEEKCIVWQKAEEQNLTLHRNFIPLYAQNKTIRI